MEFVALRFPFPFVAISLLLTGFAASTPAQDRSVPCPDHYEELVGGRPAQSLPTTTLLALTPSIRVVKVEQVDVGHPDGEARYSYWATLENLSGKTVIDYTFSAGTPDPETLYRDLYCPRGHSNILHAELPITGSSTRPGGATLVSAVFSDGTSEGDALRSERVKFRWVGHVIAHREIERLLQSTTALSSSSMPGPEGVVRVQRALEALPEDPSALVGHVPQSDQDRSLILALQAKSPTDPLANARRLGIQDGLVAAKKRALRHLDGLRRQPSAQPLSSVLEVSRSLLPPEGFIDAVIGGVQ